MPSVTLRPCSHCSTGRHGGALVLVDEAAEQARGDRVVEQGGYKGEDGAGADARAAEQRLCTGVRWSCESASARLVVQYDFVRVYALVQVLEYRTRVQGRQ
jgi:hypothetical protein